MMATTVMGVVMIVWCLVTIAVRPEKRALPTATPNLSKKVDAHGKPVLDPFGKQVDPLGWLGETALGHSLRPERIQGSWLSLIGVIGIVLSFGHSILAMSGEETLAQVYREVESPKLKNFKRAALVVFLYSLLFTSLISFFAVMIIPDEVRMSRYSDNLIGGLAMNVIGPMWARLILNGIVVIVGFLILSGAVNTAIVGSNGVLNRVSEDGVLPDWFLKPHPKFGTSSRLLHLVVMLADHHDRLQPGRRAGSGRGLRLRRRLELRVHVALDADPPLQAARAPRIRGAVQHSGGAIRLAGGNDVDLPGPGGRGDRQPAHQGGGDDHRRGVHRRLLRRVPG